MTEIKIEDAAKFRTILLASKDFEINTYHGGGREIHAMLPEDMTHPAIGFLVVYMPSYGWKNTSKCYRFDTLDEAYDYYNTGTI